MADITMCRGECEGFVCNIREACYRFTATPGEYQSFFTKQVPEGEKCKYFWDNGKLCKSDCGAGEAACDRCENIKG